MMSDAIPQADVRTGIGGDDDNVTIRHSIPPQ
jgi:hypothetical protein